LFQTIGQIENQRKVEEREKTEETETLLRPQ
jgi:hypothetical protein